MSESEKDRLFREGVAAIRAGDKAAGREKLEKVVEIDQLHEQAWLWLSAVVETQGEKITCLQNALTINPRSEPARRGLAQLGVEVEEPEPASAQTPAASGESASAKPGEEWRAQLYKDQPPVPSPDAREGKWISDAILIPTEEEVHRTVFDLANAWASALIFKVVGDYKEHVEDGPAGHILLNVSVAIFLQVLAYVVVVGLIVITGRDTQGVVNSFNEIVDALNRFSAVGLVPEPFRPVVGYLEQQTPGTQFSPVDAAVAGSLTLVFALFLVATVLIAFVSQLVRAMVFNSVAAWMGGKGGIIQTTQALTIALVAYHIVALPLAVAGAILPDTLSAAAGFGLFIYKFIQDAVAIDAAHQIGVPASAGAVVIGWVLIGVLLCCLGGGLVFLLSQ